MKITVKRIGLGGVIVESDMPIDKLSDIEFDLDHGTKINVCFENNGFALEIRSITGDIRIKPIASNDSRIK